MACDKTASPTSVVGTFDVSEKYKKLMLTSLEDDSFACGELFNKMANLCGDLSKTALKNTGKFKQLTGRDLIHAARKFKSRIKFVNYAKMIFSANEMPMTHDLTFAFFNRWITIDFPYTFLPQKEIDRLSDKDRKNVKLQDPEIIERISTPEEMSGLLNWALDGLDRLLKNKDFSYSPNTEETKRRWLRRSDSCTAFIMDCIESNFNEYVSKSDFRQEYAAYCFRHKLTISSDNSIKYLLSTIVGASDDRKTNENGKQEHVWKGIKLINEKKEKTEEENSEINEESVN